MVIFRSIRIMSCFADGTESEKAGLSRTLPQNFIRLTYDQLVAGYGKGSSSAVTATVKPFEGDGR